jgi:cobyric acid synthase
MTHTQAATLMIQDTASDEGKSILVAGFCCCLKPVGHEVAPCKPKNMASDSTVTADGGQIDRARVFAHLIGMLAFLSASKQNRGVGFVINKFCGEITLLQSGLDWLEAHTNKSVLGGGLT